MVNEWLESRIVNNLLECVNLKPLFVPWLNSVWLCLATRENVSPMKSPNIWDVIWWLHKKLFLTKIL